MSMFTAIPLSRRQSATVTIEADGTICLPSRTNADGKTFAPSKIGKIPPDLAAAIVEHVSVVYDELKALKAANAAAKAAAAAEDDE